MYKLNGLKIIPGERFVTKANRRVFKIERLEGACAIVRDVATGKTYSYGVEALKRLEVERRGAEQG